MTWELARLAPTNRRAAFENNESEITCSEELTSRSRFDMRMCCVTVHS